ncbi:MAG: glycosyltransferase [Pseudomonadota bacterium]
MGRHLHRGRGPGGAVLGAEQPGGFATDRGDPRSARGGLGQSFRPPVSVAVMTRDRPRLLAGTLRAIRRLRYRPFELIVIGDRLHWSDLAAQAGIDWLGEGDVVYRHCPELSVSRARNLALAAAEGEILAFCDDDAIPAPNWLCELIPAFEDTRVAAAGGLVRAACGDKIESLGFRVDSLGNVDPMPWDGRAERCIHPPTPGAQVVFRGVNSAFRIAALRAIGGVDPRYRYFLEETDAIVRLAAAGGSVALCPGAEIRHLSAENRHRDRRGKPRDPYEIAASTALFLRKLSLKETLQISILKKFFCDWQRRIDHLLRLAVFSASDRDWVEARLRAGVVAGLVRAARPAKPLASRPTDKACHGAGWIADQPSPAPPALNPAGQSFADRDATRDPGFPGQIDLDPALAGSREKTTCNWAFPPAQ